MLGASNFDVKTYNSARSFLEQTAGVPVGCIVTDVRMPEMSGIELVEAGHYPAHMVKCVFSDRSTACMTEHQFDAIMDHAFGLAREL